MARSRRARLGLADVLPYFLKLETDLDFDGPLHGKQGPIPIRRIARDAMPQFGKAVGEALSATGLPFGKDQNAEFLKLCISTYAQKLEGNE